MWIECNDPGQLLLDVCVVHLSIGMEGDIAEASIHNRHASISRIILVDKIHTTSECVCATHVLQLASGSLVASGHLLVAATLPA